MMSIKETGITKYPIAIQRRLDTTTWDCVLASHQGTIASVHKGEHINALAHSGDKWSRALRRLVDL